MKTARKPWGTPGTKPWTLTALALGLLWAAIGCAPAHTAPRATGDAQLAAVAGEPPNLHCLFGLPAKSADWSRGPSHLIRRPGYTLEHSSTDKVPLWVCERVTPQHIQGPAQRGSFKPDPDLPAGERAELADYKNSGYDRGHQAPAADFKYDPDRMNESFYLSNMVPQVGQTFNQARWRVLEERIRACIADRGEVYVVTGPLFWQTQAGDTAHAPIGDNRVAVPTHLYKIVVAPSATGGWDAVAFVLANADHPVLKDAEYDFRPYVVSIDWVEQRTDLNFMPELDEANPDLERQLEAQPATELWPCLQSEP